MSIRTMDLPIATLFYSHEVTLRTRPDSPVLAQFSSQQDFLDDLTEGTAMPIMTVPAPPAGQVRKSVLFKIGLNYLPHGDKNHGFGSMGQIDIHAVNPASPFTPPEVRIVGTPVAYVDSIDVIRPNQPPLHVPLPANTTQIDLMATAAGPILKTKEPVTIEFHLHLVSNLGVSVMSTGFNVFARGTPWAELYYWGQLDLDYATALAQPAA